jgi:hypothetical protein
MIQIGLYISTLTEFLDQMLWAGAFFVSPSRLYVLALLGSTFLGYAWKRTPIELFAIARRYALAVSLLLMVSLISAFNSPYVGYSIKRVLNATSLYLIPIFVYLYLRNRYSIKDVPEILQSIGKNTVVIGGIVSVFGFVQAFTGWLQFSSEFRPVFGIPLARINSFFLDKNFCAYFLVFPFWLLVAGGEAATGIRARTIRWSLALLILTAIALTGSRGGLLMIAAAISSHLLQRALGSRRAAISWIECLLVVLSPTLMLFAAYYGFEFIWQHVSSFDTSTESGFSRIMSWYSGLMIYLRDPILGVGPGHFVVLNKGIYLPFNYVPAWVAGRISPLAAHSNVLETLVETGPLALAAYFWIQFIVYRGLLRAQHAISAIEVYRSLYFAAAIGNCFISYYSIFLMLLTGVLLFAVTHCLTSAEFLAEQKPRSAKGRRTSQPAAGGLAARNVLGEHTV